MSSSFSILQVLIVFSPHPLPLFLSSSSPNDSSPIPIPLFSICFPYLVLKLYSRLIFILIFPCSVVFILNIGPLFFSYSFVLLILLCYFFLLCYSFPPFFLLLCSFPPPLFLFSYFFQWLLSPEPTIDPMAIAGHKLSMLLGIYRYVTIIRHHH